MGSLAIGIDVGNSSTKSQNTITPSGYKMQSIKPCLSTEWIEYEGKYYTASEERFAYSMDKTENGHALILSLFAIAKEIIFMSYEIHNRNIDKQEFVNRYHKINLGIGLPPGHFDNLKGKTEAYYKETFKDGLSFTYCSQDKNNPCGEIRFNITLNTLRVFPQDIMAVLLNPEVQIVDNFEDYYIIGIGGYTVDIIRVRKGQADPSFCISLPEGTSVMYKNIIKEVLKAGIQISSESIEKVLLGEPTMLSEQVIDIIKSNAQLHADGIIDSAINNGVNFHEYPAVYFGGGGLLLKEQLMRNKNVIKYQFIDDICANAKIYAKFVKE